MTTTNSVTKSVTKNATEPMIGGADEPWARAANIVVLRGRLVNEPTRRELPAGRVVVQFDVSTQVSEGDRVTTISAPVAWLDPSDAASATLVVGEEFLVVGSVRRRFFRVGGATQSRTEVVADRVIPVRRRKQVDAALADVYSTLGSG